MCCSGKKKIYMIKLGYCCLYYKLQSAPFYCVFYFFIVQTDKHKKVMFKYINLN